ncbi:hypothetical protein LCX93_04925 [Sulfurimonas sp. SWIR-19]|uniref:hypothetical protein n=1 Tax=Sulfurimonas sp. SWIR-19 TaxID=2878390 RepID=UPI001CF29C8D|nr:hypothetical protein [Sulfurimonas sp. SWIR-19]UCN01261.1 hypothetical protein LCX93_04925 [Sulfurimonas sp. SWIR-19]
MIEQIRLLYYRFFKKPEKFYTAAMEKERDAILSEFDKEYRLKEVHNIELTKNEFKTNMLYAADRLYQLMINASNSVYQKIQISEANYSVIKSELDDKLYNELANLENEKQEIKTSCEDIKKEIQNYEQQSKAIEREFNKLSNREVVGDLHKLPWWIFITVMLIVGAAELLIYQNVFLSQEIGLNADMPAEKQNQVFWTSIVMAVGFVGMIIWMAHALGKLLRHFSNTTQKEKKIYIVKMLVITLISFLAIWATVDIRSKMHTILADDTAVKNLKAQQDKMNKQQLFGSDAKAEFGSATDDEALDEGFGNSDEDESGFGDEEEPTDNLKETSLDEKMQVFREDAQKKKEDTAYVFIIINLFIFIGGAFLSYFSHTSSPIYEMIEAEIAKLSKKYKKCKKEIIKIEKKMSKLKKNEINKLFSRLVTAALFYDISVRTYNAYVSSFKIQLELIESYLREIYKERGVTIEENYVEFILSEYIVLDNRKELQHVNNIEEYMIYHDRNQKDVKEEKDV